MTTEETLARVEELTTEVFGRGAAVSVDEDGDRWRVRCWDAKGAMVSETSPRKSRGAAIGAMLFELGLELDIAGGEGDDES